MKRYQAMGLLAYPNILHPHIAHPTNTPKRKHHSSMETSNRRPPETPGVSFMNFPYFFRSGEYNMNCKRKRCRNKGAGAVIVGSTTVSKKPARHFAR